MHTDARAAESAASVNALAYTVGNHIVVGRGGFQPLNSTRLLAHELVHVQQQSVLGRSDSLQRRDAVVSQPEALTERQGGSADDIEEQSKPSRRITIPWQGTLHESLRALARPYTVSAADADAAATAMIEAVGAQWQIKTAEGVRTGLDEAAMNANMTMSDKFFLGEGELLSFFADQLGVSQEELLATDLDQIERRAIEAEWPLLEDPALASVFMDLLDHFTEVKPALVDATDGLSEEEIWALVDQDGQVKVLAGLFTQNYTDFTKSAPDLDLDRFLLLEEVIFQQYVWGNPNAIRNFLTPGKGRTEEGEADRFGIIHRESGQLLYDEGGVPLWTSVGTLLRDSGYRAYEPLFGAGVEKQLDPATEMLIEVVTRNVSDPLAISAVTAKWIDNPELRLILGERVLIFVGPELAKGIPSAIDMFAVFAGMHFLAQYLIRLGHPAAMAAGLALEAALKGVEFFMNIDFGEAVITRLLQSGENLARVQFEDDGGLDALSKRHVDEAAKPIALILVDLIIQIGASKLGRMLPSQGRREPTAR